MAGEEPGSVYRDLEDLGNDLLRLRAWHSTYKIVVGCRRCRGDPLACSRLV
jgi:hypothetical protein